MKRAEAIICTGVEGPRKDVEGRVYCVLKSGQEFEGILPVRLTRP
jgi:hypothetical protein